MQILSTPPPPKKKSTLSVNALTTFMYVHNFFHKVWLYSLEGCIHEHCICLCLLPLSYLPHNEPDYRHILRSICRIVATISVRRLDANRSTANPYSRVMENGTDWSSVTHQMSNTELISPGQVSASEVPPLQKVVQTITRLIKMH